MTVTTIPAVLTPKEVAELNGGLVPLLVLVVVCGLVVVVRVVLGAVLVVEDWVTVTVQGGGVPVTLIDVEVGSIAVLVTAVDVDVARGLVEDVLEETWRRRKSRAVAVTSPSVVTEPVALGEPGATVTVTQNGASLVVLEKILVSVTLSGVLVVAPGLLLKVSGMLMVDEVGTSVVWGMALTATKSARNVAEQNVNFIGYQREGFGGWKCKPESRNGSV